MQHTVCSHLDAPLQVVMDEFFSLFLFFSLLRRRKTEKEIQVRKANEGHIYRKEESKHKIKKEF